MSRLTHSSRNPSTGHNGGVHPPDSGGGDDRGGRGSGDSLPNYGERLRHARLALAVFMTPICMLFLSFTVVYLARRGYLSFDTTNDVYIRQWIPIRLPWALLLLNTAILLVSSFTIDRARRAITREAALSPISNIPGISLGDERHFPWLTLTSVLGVLFLAGQLLVWNNLSRQGFHMTGGTSSSFIYMLTAMHGLHLAGGVLALLIANVASLLHRPVESRRIVVDVTSWYWHFMAGLWIYILVLFSFAAQ